MVLDEFQMTQDSAEGFLSGNTLRVDAQPPEFSVFFQARIDNACGNIEATFG